MPVMEAGDPHGEDQGGGRLLHPRRRAGGARGSSQALRGDAPAAGRRPLAPRGHEPRRRRARTRASTRTASTSTATSPGTGTSTASTDRCTGRARARSRSRRAGRSTRSPPGPAEAGRLVPPGARAGRRVRRRPRARAASTRELVGLPLMKLPRYPGSARAGRTTSSPARPRSSSSCRAATSARAPAIRQASAALALPASSRPARSMSRGR